MNESTSHHIMLVGLPNTGKTSFLAALWYMVDQRKVKCALVLDRLDGDRKYLNQIRDAWMDYKPVPHNPLDLEKVTSMLLKDSRTGGAVRLSVPDLSGESFTLQWTKRQLTVGCDKLLRQATAAMLFVSAEGTVKPHRIDTIDELSALLDDPPAPPALSPDTPQPQPKSWNIESTPTQVQLVELLQIISSRDYFRAPFRIALIVSAFDLLKALPITPEAYILRELPLLKQFISANANLFEIAYYGISAQGGRYASPLLSSEMIVDVKGLASRIVEMKDPLSAWISKQLDPNTQAALKDLADPERARNPLADSLNALLSKVDFFEQTRFATVPLRPETKYLLREGRLKGLKSGPEVTSLNRMLLEDAYPSELSRNWQYHEEHSNLQKQPPSHRVLVVGTQVHDAHDLTEPIQWLMQ